MKGSKSAIRYKTCARCSYKRYYALFRNNGDTCNLCRFGQYRAPVHEYITPWDMKLASAVSRAPLTRFGILAAIVNASVMTPVKNMRATP